MDISRITHTKHTESTEQESAPVKTAQKPSGIVMVKDELQSAAEASNLFEETIGQSVNGQTPLTSEQQNIADKLIKEFTDKLNSKDQSNSDDQARADLVDSKKAGNNTQASDKFAKLTDDQRAALLGGPAQEPESDAVKDADKLLEGATLKDLINGYLDQRNKELSDMTGRDVGGDLLKQLQALTDPTARLQGHETSGVSKGKEMFEDSLGVDPTPEEVEAYKKKYAKEHPDNPPASSTPPPENNPTKVETPSIVDVLENILFTWATKESPLPTPPTPPDPETGRNMLDGFRAIFGSKDRTPESEAKKGGGLHMPDPENYQGNIPEELQKFMDYLKGQALALKPKTGGETELTDGGADGSTTATGGPVDNLFTKLGKMGLLGNPGSVERDNASPSGSLPTGNLTQPNNGTIDYGPDSDKTGWDGPTHTDDPGDVHFGASGALDPNAISAKNKDSDDDDDHQNKKGLNFTTRRVKT
jgi:hypothetical protein